MKKIKLTKEQFKVLTKNINEEAIKGVKDVNRVDNTFKKEFRKEPVKNITVKSNESMSMSKFDIKKPSRIGNTKIPKMEESHNMSEDTQSAVELLKHFADLIYYNPSQKGLSAFYKQNGITWGDIAAYLTSVGILGVTAGGIHRIVNIFNKRYETKEEKLRDLPKIANIAIEKIEQNSNELSDKSKGDFEETPWEKKVKQQRVPYDGYKPNITYNPNRFKPATPTSPEELDSLMPKLIKYDNDNSVNELAFDNQDDDCRREFPSKKDIFKGQYMNREIALLNGPDGSYMFDYGDISREELPNPDCELDVEDIAMFVSRNHKDSSIIKIGNTLKEDYIQGRADLIKLTEDVKQWLRETYSKDKKFVDVIDKLMEVTSTESSGSNTGLFGCAPKRKKNIANPEYTPAEQLKIVNDEEKFLGGKITDEAIKKKTPIEKPNDDKNNYQYYDEFSQMLTDKRAVSKLQKTLNRGYNMIGTGKWEDKKTTGESPYPLKPTDLPLDKFLALKKAGKIDEMTAAGSPTGNPSSTTTGPHDVNALPNISRNGNFKKNPKKSNAFKKTQYPKGGFVEFNDCVKLNNKPAGAGCSQGAVDNVVKTYKTKDSVISKSIYETISAKTGRSVDDIKTLIESKKKNKRERTF